MKFPYKEKSLHTRKGSVLVSTITRATTASASFPGAIHMKERPRLIRHSSDNTVDHSVCWLFSFPRPPDVKR